MEPFLKSYYDHFKYKSIDSEQFKAFFLDYFKNEPKVSSIDWDGWFNNPGMPPYKPDYDDTLAVACKTLRYLKLSFSLLRGFNFSFIGKPNR